MPIKLPKKLTRSLSLFVSGVVAGYILATTTNGDLIPTSQNTIPTPTVTYAPTQITSSLVKRVIDGDTIELENGQKVRYIGIDTPELASKDCYAQEAFEKNKELVEGAIVYLEKDVSETDRYGRLLRYVYLTEPDLGVVSINEQLVQEGYAFAVTYPPDVKYTKNFQNRGEDARSTKKGGWSNCSSFTSS